MGRRRKHGSRKEANELTFCFPPRSTSRLSRPSDISTVSTVSGALPQCSATVCENRVVHGVAMHTIYHTENSHYEPLRYRDPRLRACSARTGVLSVSKARYTLPPSVERPAVPECDPRSTLRKFSVDFVFQTLLARYAASLRRTRLLSHSSRYERYGRRTELQVGTDGEAQTPRGGTNGKGSLLGDETSARVERTRARVSSDTRSG